MCGIAGIITPNARNYAEPLQRMTSAIAHRGPDAEGHEFFENAALGHRRLSIVDLSESGHQPMFSSSRKECIVLNGEIYGYQEIKNKLSNYPYRGTSDTEVILAMYKEGGSAMIHDLPGMFAFALWDEARQELFCARDRFGEKPFYYAIGKNGEFIFASEIKSILASGLIQPEINNEALFHFLKNGYVSAHQSIYSNIFTLPPAHVLIWSDGKTTIKKYWQIPAKDFNITLSEAKEEFESLLRNAVKKQLVADVKVGSFLSGGLDSSTIVAMVNEFLAVQTTISFGYNSEQSELKYAREIAQKYQTQHIEIHEDKGNIAKEILTVSKFFDEPFADMSYVPQYKICEAAAKHLSVVLAGDVGDELFGGYSFYSLENRLKNHFSYDHVIAQYGLRFFRKMKPVSYITEQNLRYAHILDFHQNQVRNFFSVDEIRKLGISETYEQEHSFNANSHSLNDIMRVDLEKYVPGNMLVKSDRMAMANSLEVRTPFLDKEFAEFCIQLPEQLKLSGDHDKIILRESMSKYWTESIRSRHKQGFGLSVKNWLEEKNMKDLSNDLLLNSDSKIFEMISFEAAKSFLDGDRKEWNLLQLAVWAENYSEHV